MKYKGSTPTQMTDLSLSNIAGYVLYLEDGIEHLRDLLNKRGIHQ